MRKIACVLALTCVIASDVWSADKPTTLELEQMTTLHVGELALLQIPSERRYSRRGSVGIAGEVLVIVRRSRHSVLYRATKPGRATIVISPDTRNGQCISCATLHYFIIVVPQT